MGGDTSIFITQTVAVGANDRGNVISPGGDRIAPRSGQQAYRTNKMGGPLLTPAHNRAISMNVSALGGYGGGPEQITSMDIDRERSKIARFLSTKERCGLRFQEREAKAEARLKQIDARTVDFEKRKKLDRKIVAQKLKEKQEEVEEKKNKVE